MLKRELLEIAQRKRMYVLRGICLLAFSLIFMTMYLDVTSRAVNVMRMLGNGQELTIILLVSSFVVIYALAPAMSCTAVSSEMEKQTLSLLLISKLSPWKIVVEKILSRMVPLITLVVVMCPLLAVSYVFGGVSFGQSMIGIGMLLAAIVQVTSISVCFSALLRSGIAAFWATYIFLVLTYFAWPFLMESHFVPRTRFLGLRDVEYMFFPAYQMAMLMTESDTWQKVLFLTLPQTLLTLCFPLVAWLAVRRYDEADRYSLSERLSRRVRSVRKSVRRFAWGSRVLAVLRLVNLRFVAFIRSARTKLLESLAHVFRGGTLSSFFERRAKSMKPATRGGQLPDSNAVSWRESRTGWLGRLPLMRIGLLALLSVQFIAVASARRGDYDEICALFSIGTLIITLLVVMGLSCRLFALEREKQTLSTLLAAPFRNEELLLQKHDRVNQLIVRMLWLFAVTCLFNLLFTRFRGSSAFVYLICVFGNAYIYMKLILWTGTFFSLRLNTQMKAMVATLVSILALCFIPMLLHVVLTIATNSRPDKSALFVFSSPMIIPVLNEFHDLEEGFERNWLPDSELLIVILGFLVFGGLTALVKSATLKCLPDLLNRIDVSITQSSGPELRRNRAQSNSQ